MPTSATEPSGARRFELIRTLGTGSFGSVYLAEMEGAGGFRRRVALKLLNPTWDAGSDAGRRLRDEARLLGRLQHRHIVRVDDLIRLEGRWALVMEYVPGVDLEAVVAPPEGATAIGAMSVRAVLEVVAAVASALRAAHSSPDSDGRPLEVVHRDIKPSNIRITESGELKVLDFGVARASFAGRESKTEQVRYGSLGYMAPERLLGGDETPAGDIYALGVVMFELVTRRTLGRAELAPDAQVGQVKRSAEELAVIAREDVAQLFTRMMEYEPETRPHAREVEELARRLAGSRTDTDFASWCLQNVPLLEGLGKGGEPGLTGRILAESDQTGRPIVNGSTIAVPEAEVAELAAAMPMPRASREVASETIVLPTEPPAAVGGPRRMAWLVGGLTVFGGLLAVIYLTSKPPPPPVTLAIPAASPAGRELPAVAEPALTPPPEAALRPAPDESALSAAPPTVVASGPPSNPRGAPPTAPAGARAAAPTPAAPSTEPAAPAAVTTTPTLAAPPDAPRLRSAKFVVAGVTERVDVVCGDVRANGSGNALLQSFPAGRCTVSVGGATTSVDVQEPRKVDCTLQGANLTCR